MPSDSKKKKEQQKKEARKTKNVRKPNSKAENDEENDIDNENEENGEVETVVEKTNGAAVVNHGLDKEIARLAKQIDNFELVAKTNAENRACTGKN
jgi:hypothetical protein